MNSSNLVRLLPVAIFAVIVGFFAIALNSGDPSKLPSTMIGKQAPATTFPALEGLAADGKPVPGFSNADLAKGRISIVNFWASWCVPCVDEHPLLAGLKEQSGADIYGVNYKDQNTTARRFLGSYGNPFTAVGTDLNGRGAIDWGVYGMPESFVINGMGEIIYKQVGPMTEESIKTKIIPAIEAARKAIAKN
jgi:cytochrome c biogenesis protein CcmG/thiol:disulfide interchange protein DsbE